MKPRLLPKSLRLRLLRRNNHEIKSLASLPEFRPFGRRAPHARSAAPAEGLSDRTRGRQNSRCRKQHNERIRLFLTFAEDRLKKFQYELEHPSSNRHGDMLNSLLNAYVGCVDDAADLIQLGLEKQDNIRKGVDLMSSRTKEFLVVLGKISAEGPEKELYKDNLDDAIEGTRDAMNDAEKAKKKVAPPPIRRKN